MNQVLEWLLGGDLRSDGLSTEVANFVLANPLLMDELLEGLDEEQDLVRGRTADALEKIARQSPELLVPSLPKLLAVANDDPLPMVKMHIAMLLGHLAMYTEHAGAITHALLEMLDDRSVFARSWAIASLCIMGRKHQQERSRIVESIAGLQGDSSIAIRTRVRNALTVLTDEQAPFPKGWIKSNHLEGI
jgi:HEAT repeat protein